MRLTFFLRSLCFALMMLFLSTASFAEVSISVSFAPPALPVYEQPPVPEDGYVWVPGYWAYAEDDYYWVPGTWVMPPEPGLLWTPGYWSYSDDGYVFNDGTGDRPSASTAGLITATDILGRAMREGAGRTDSFTTTAR
jgi:hypothetical protein